MYHLQGLATFNVPAALATGGAKPFLGHFLVDHFFLLKDLMGNRQLLVGNRRHLEGNRRRSVGNRWRLVGK